MLKERIQEDIKQLKLERNLTESQRRELLKLQHQLKFYDDELHNMLGQFAQQALEEEKLAKAVADQAPGSSFTDVGVDIVLTKLKELLAELIHENDCKSRLFERMKPPPCSRS